MVLALSIFASSIFTSSVGASSIGASSFAQPLYLENQYEDGKYGYKKGGGDFSPEYQRIVLNEVSRAVYRDDNHMNEPGYGQGY